MAKNKLVLNSDKTHLLVLASSKNHKKHDNYGLTLDTGSEIIEPSDYEKLLGGYVSNWKEHIRDNEHSLFKILTSRINALSKISKISSFKTRKIIANGIFISKLIYLIQLWGGCSQFLLNFLQKLKNRAARLVTKRNVYTPVQDLLTQCGWLSIRQLIVYHDLLQVYKTKKTQRPGYLVKKFSRKFGAGNRYPTSLSESDAIRVDSRIRTDLGKSNFSYVAANLWNQLPVAIRRCPTLGGFKSSTKRWIKYQHRNRISFYILDYINPSRTLINGSYE